MAVRVGRYLIYGLIDPRDRGLKYIGKTHKRREWRLSEHIRQAVENDKRPVYDWLRALLVLNIEPEIFVWKRISATDNWREAEKEAIAFWKGANQIEFPYIHPPQTKKSIETIIQHASLLNVRARMIIDFLGVMRYSGHRRCWKRS